MSIAAERQKLIAVPLWDRARAVLARAVAAVGSAAAIAGLKPLTPALRRRILGWLYLLENVVRKLLLAEAGRIERTADAAAPRVEIVALAGLGLARHAAPAAALFRNAPAPVQKAARALDLSKPQTWPARFSLSPPRDPHLVPDARAPRIRALWGAEAKAAPPATRTCGEVNEAACAFQLARRIEALRRVLENPLPHARRLARLLLRLRRRFPEAIWRYAMAPARVNDFDPDDPRLGVEACAAGFGGAGVLADTS